MAVKPQPLNRKKHVFWGIYSIPGGGKTSLIGTLPGTLLIRPPTEHNESIVDQDNCDEIIVDGWNAMEEVKDDARGGAYDKYTFVWLDSISIFQDTGLDEIWEDTVAAKPSRKGGPIDKGEYGKNMTRLAQWVRAIVGADRFNFGWTAHVNPADDRYDHAMPWVQGKQMPEKMCGYMQMVGFLDLVKQKGETVRVLRTQATDEYYAKCQYRKSFPKDRMVEPTMQKLIAEVEKTRPVLLGTGPKVIKARATSKSNSTGKKKPVRKKGSN